MSRCFEYPQYHHLTHEKFFKTIWKKSLKNFEVKICLVIVTILYGYCRVLDEVLTLNVSKNFLCTFQACSTYLKGSPEPGLFNARWIECLRCVKHKLKLTKAQRMSNFVLSSHIWLLMARSDSKLKRRFVTWMTPLDVRLGASEHQFSSDRENRIS